MIPHLSTQFLTLCSAYNLAEARRVAYLLATDRTYKRGCAMRGNKASRISVQAFRTGNSALY